MSWIQNGQNRLLVRNIIKARFEALEIRKPPLVIMLSTSVLNLTNHPNSEQFLGTANSLVIRQTLDTSWFEKVRIGARVNVVSTSANSPRLYLGYTASLSNTPTFTILGDGQTTSGQAISLLSNGQRLTSRIDLPEEAIGENITFQIFQNGGDGVSDPQLTSVWIEFI